MTLGILESMNEGSLDSILPIRPQIPETQNTYLDSFPENDRTSLYYSSNKLQELNGVSLFIKNPFGKMMF